MRKYLIAAVTAALLGLMAGADSTCFFAGSGSGTGTIGASGDNGGVVVVH